jgi:hypothetical protein
MTRASGGVWSVPPKNVPLFGIFLSCHPLVKDGIQQGFIMNIHNKSVSYSRIVLTLFIFLIIPRLSYCIYSSEEIFYARASSHRIVSYA